MVYKATDINKFSRCYTELLNMNKITKIHRKAQDEGFLVPIALIKRGQKKGSQGFL